MKTKIQAEKSAVHTDLFDRRWVKALLFLFIPGAIFILISAGIRVSQLGIDHTIVVMCDKKLVSGSSGAMRLTLIDDNSGFFLPERVAARLSQNGQTQTLFDDEVLASGYAVSRNFEVPKFKTGPATLEIAVYFDGQTRLIRKKIKIVQQLPKTKLAYPSDVKPDVIVATAKSGEATIRVYPEGRGAPAGLPSLLFVQAVDDSTRPVSSPYQLQLPVFRKGEEPKNISGNTDAFGLDAFVIQPTDLHYPIKVMQKEVESPEPPPDTETAASDDTEAVTGTDASRDSVNNSDSDSASLPAAPLTPTVVFSGMKMDFKTPLVDHGDPMEIQLQQISGNEPVYLDIFKDNQWLHSETGWANAEGKATFTISAPENGVLRIQASSSPLQYTRNIAVRHIYIKAKGETNRDVLGKLQRRQKSDVHRNWLGAVLKSKNIETSESSRLRLLAAFSLSRLYHGHSPLPQLLSSRRDDDTALNAFKRDFQIGLTVAILLLGFSVAVLITVIAIQTSRKQKALTKMILDGADDDVGEIAAETDDGNEPFSGRPVQTGRFATWIQIGTLFLVILAAFTAIALLVLTLSWNQTPGL